MDNLNRVRETGLAAAGGLRALALLALLAAGGLHEGAAQTDIEAAEYRVKAAFLYKFGGYVEWPERAFARPDSPIAIGVIGADALAGELAQIVAGRTINGRPVTVRKLRRGEAVAGLHVLFVGRSDSSRLADILAAAKGQPLLTVTETEEAFESGSMINFVVVEDKVRFDVAPPPAEPGNLKISARLLAVARKVVAGS
jgi:hypothetical protein